jgi:predicted GTPase
MEKSESLKDSKIYDNIEKFSQVMKQDTELWPIFACQLERMRSIIESPLKIAVMGEFKSGKSSFLNSLLGHHDLLPVGVIPKTATINELIYGQKAQITICYKDNIRESHDGYSILKQYNQASEQDNIVLALERVDRIVVTVESDYLKHFTIIDTPGFNQAEAASLDEKSISILAEVDLVIWLFRASQAGTFTEMGYLEKIKGSVKKLYAVFNRIDEVNVNVEELRQALSKHFDGVFINQNTVLGICAEHKHREKNTELKHGFEQLLHDLIFNEDYKLSLERLKDIHTNLYSDIAARIQYLDRKSIKLTDGLSTFKNDNFISPENGTCPYAKLLKSHSRGLALCFADEIAGEVDRCNRTELLKITKQASNIDVSRSSIIEFL